MNQTPPRVPASTETVGGATNYAGTPLQLPRKGLPPCTEPLPASLAANSTPAPLPAVYNFE